MASTVLSRTGKYVGLAAVISLPLAGIFILQERQAARVPITTTIDEVKASINTFRQNQQGSLSARTSTDSSTTTKETLNSSSEHHSEESGSHATFEYAEDRPFQTTPGVYRALSSLNLNSDPVADCRFKDEIIKQLPYALTEKEFSRLTSISSKMVNGIVREDLGLDSTKVSEERLSEIAAVVAVIYKQAEFLHVAQTNLPNIRTLSDIPDWSLQMLEDRARERNDFDKAVFGSALQSQLIGVIQTLTELQIPVSEWATFGIFPK